MEETWSSLMAEIYGDNFGYDPDALSGDICGDYPPYCCQQMDSEAVQSTSYCQRHADLLAYCSYHCDYSDEASLHEIRMIWQNEVMSLYDQWAQSLSESNRASVEASRATFFASAQMQYEAIDAYCRRENGAVTSYRAEWIMKDYMCNQAAWLCQLLGDMTGSGEDQ